MFANVYDGRVNFNLEYNMGHFPPGQIKRGDLVFVDFTMARDVQGLVRLAMRSITLLASGQGNDPANGIPVVD